MFARPLVLYSDPFYIFLLFSPKFSIQVVEGWAWSTDLTQWLQLRVTGGVVSSARKFLGAYFSGFPHEEHL